MNLSENQKIIKQFRFMKKITFIILFLLTAAFIQAQEQKPKLYDPMADAKMVISNAVKQAKAENKHVLIQVGGNW